MKCFPVFSLFFLFFRLLIKDNKEAQDQAVKAGNLTQKTFDLLNTYHEKQKQAEEDIIQKEVTEGNAKSLTAL